MFASFILRFACLGFACYSILACSPLRTNDALPAEEGTECSSDAECGPGLLCGSENLCSRIGSDGTGRRGDACESDAFCATGLVCGPSKVCGFYRPSEEDKRCTESIPCADGLVCNQKGRCAQPDSEGTKQIDADCQKTSECGLGLFCGTDDKCEQFPKWSGVECADNITTGTPHVMFDVPRGNEAQNYYTLPSSNDIRQYAERPNLDGYPGANAVPGPGDFMGRYVSLLREQATGYGLNASVYFRFNTPVDYSTLKFGNSGANFAFIDITEGSSRFGQPPRSRFYATEAASPYVCQNWLAIRPSEGTPPTAGHTYAVVFRRGLQDENGTPFEPSPDFALMLNPVPPNHPALAHAWRQYAPLRNWIDSEDIPAEDVIAAAVFTTGDPQAMATKLRDAVEATPSPKVNDLVQCGSGPPSPCATTRERQCSAAANGSIEIQARVELPSFLSGTPPYTTWGGSIPFADGTPKLQRLENVCMSVSLPPNGDSAPTGGWPTVIIAHDFAGHFRSPEVVKLTDKLTQLGWAVVRYDGVLHGARYGDNDAPTTEQLAEAFYNIERPDVMRDVFLQGIADLFSITRFVRDAKLETDSNIIEFDAQNIVFLGHGLGGEIDSPFLAHSSDIAAAILMDSGGSIGDMLRSSKVRLISADHSPNTLEI